MASSNLLHGPIDFVKQMGPLRTISASGKPGNVRGRFRTLPNQVLKTTPEPSARPGPGRGPAEPNSCGRESSIKPSEELMLPEESTIMLLRKLSRSEQFNQALGTARVVGRVQSSSRKSSCRRESSIKLSGVLTLPGVLLTSTKFSPDLESSSYRKLESSSPRESSRVQALARARELKPSRELKRSSPRELEDSSPFKRTYAPSYEPTPLRGVREF